MAIGLIGGLGQGLVQASSSLLQAKEDERKRAIEEEDRAKRNKLFELQYQEQKRKAAQDEYGYEDGASRMMDFLQNDAISGVKKMFEPYNQPTPTPSPTPTPGGNVPTQTPGTATVTTHGAIPGMQAPPQRGLVPSASNLRLAGIQPKYEAMKKRAAEAVARIEAETANDPEARKMRLAAYHRSMEASPEFKEVMAGLNGYVEDEKTKILYQKAIAGMEAITSRNPEAISRQFDAVLVPGTDYTIQSKDGKYRMNLTFPLVFEAYKANQQAIKLSDVTKALAEDAKNWNETREKALNREGQERRSERSNQTRIVIEGGKAAQKESEEASKVNTRYYGKVYEEIRNTGQAAASTLASIANAEQALSSGKFRSGMGAETVLGLKKAARFIGIDMDGVADAEVFQSLGNKLTLAAKIDGGKNLMPGSLSDNDLRFLQSLSPNLGKTLEGNKRLLDIMRKLATRAVRISQLATDYKMKNKNKMLDTGWDEFINSWVNKPENTLFGSGQATTPAKQTSQASPKAKITDQEIMDKL